ncbi:hypothetical protein [Spiroplasma floricola]|uniref:Uncharacterized protein n=1 Tax=Spiroplasma floricola 23-6 TaxID=1336749 RepID=A0A2K8SEP6_9MOLU|nr:hypothetical protein [Spiroplasma floricola]AUB31914.1 hypothetical protein SFLOR_v1c08660 [Spiroplasma floricola 23-6]
MARAVDNSESIKKGSFMLGGVWSATLLIATIYIAISSRFPFWWILILLSIVSITLFIIHIIIFINIAINKNTEKNISKLYWLCIIQLITLNIPLFAYELIGTLHFKKAFYTL